MLLALAGATAVASLTLLRADRRLRTELVATARESGLREAALERDLRWAADGDRARIALGRALVFAGLGEGTDGRPDAPLAVRRFEQAAALGQQALEARPTSREAATLVGAARYLAWSTARDPRLVIEHERWEAPLLLARRIGPGDREAARFLAMAYLELWSSLAESKRAEARDIVAVAFTDINTYYRLLDSWLAVAGTGAQGLAPTPPQPEAWTFLAERLAATGRNEAYCRAQEGLTAALGTQLEVRLADARRRLAGGEAQDARARFLAAIAAVPPDAAFVPAVASALDDLPDGRPEPLRADGLRAWLRFEFDQAVLGRANFDGGQIRALTRGAGLALLGPEATDGTLSLAAEAALAANDLAAAERFERHAAALTSSTWAAYWLSKARVLTERGDHDGRRRALAALTAAAPGRFVLEQAALSPVSLAGFDVGRWTFEDWSVGPKGASLLFYTARSARGLRLQLQPDSAKKAVALLRLDGRDLLCRPYAHPTEIALAAPLAPGLHRLDVVSPPGLAGFPTAVHLE